MTLALLLLWLLLMHPPPIFRRGREPPPISATTIRQPVKPRGKGLRIGKPPQYRTGPSFDTCSGLFY